MTVDICINNSFITPLNSKGKITPCLEVVLDITTWILTIMGKTLYRSSHQRCSIEKGVLKNFTKFTGKHLCQSLFFNKVAGLLY